MLDALKGLGGGRAQKQTEELEGLVAAAREERNALSALLEQVSQRSAGLAHVGNSLDEVDRKAAASLARLEELTRRVDALNQQAQAFADVETRVRALIDTVTQAHRAAEKVIAPGGELDVHRRQLQQLSSQTLEAQASYDALRKERAALEEFRAQLHQSQSEMKEAIDDASVLKGELTHLRGTSSQLTQDYARLRDTTRSAQDDSLAAIERVKQLEKRLGPLAQLQESSKTTDEKLAALNALAEHVSQKTKALDSQKHTVERAVLEAGRLNEMVWGMDVQIGKLNEGLKQIGRGEEAIARIEKLVADAVAGVEAATRTRDQFARESARLEYQGRSLLDSMRGYVDRLGLDKKEFEGFTQRLRALGTSIADAETRLEALAGKQRHLDQLGQSITALSKDVHGLTAQADDLATKQATIQALHDALGDVDGMARKAAAQFDGLKQSRAELDALRSEIVAVHTAHSDVAQLRDRLAADRHALEAFAGRFASFKARTPELEATMDVIQGKLSQVEQGTAAATKLGELTSELDAQLSRVSGRLQFVDRLEERLNALHALSAHVDAQSAEQLARRAELDRLKTRCDGVVAQMLD